MSSASADVTAINATDSHNQNNGAVDDSHPPPKYRCYAIVHVFFAVCCFGVAIGGFVMGSVVVKDNNDMDDRSTRNSMIALAWSMAAYGINGTVLCILGTMVLRGTRSSTDNVHSQADIFRKAYLCAFYINLIVIPVVSLLASIGSMDGGDLLMVWSILYFPIGWILAIMTGPLAMSVHRIVLNCCLKCPPCAVFRVDLDGSERDLLNSGYDRIRTTVRFLRGLLEAPHGRGY